MGIIENQSCETLLVVEIQLFSSPRQSRVVRQSWPLHVKHCFPLGVPLLDSVEQKKRSTELPQAIDIGADLCFSPLVLTGARHARSENVHFRTLGDGQRHTLTHTPINSIIKPYIDIIHKYIGAYG